MRPARHVSARLVIELHEAADLALQVAVSGMSGAGISPVRQLPGLGPERRLQLRRRASLIRSYAGTPTGFGQGVRAHLRSVH